MRSTARILALVSAAVVAAGGALVGTAAAAAPAPASVYRIIDLGTRGGGGSSSAAAINARGHIAGQSNGHAVLWRDGRIVDLGLLPGGAVSFATDLNDRDEVVGYAATAAGTTHAFVWRDGRMRDLGAMAGDNSYAFGINNAGDIVGWSATEANNNGLHAIRWRGGRMIDLEPDLQYSIARDITDDGWIVGLRSTPTHPANAWGVAWWHGSATMIMADTGDMPMAANDRHEAVGIFGTLVAGGQTTQLPTPAGATVIQAYGLNNRTQVVGFTDFTAVLWDHGTTIELPGLSAGVTGAYDINDRGQIVGTSATTPEGINQHAVLWTHP